MIKRHILDTIVLSTKTFPITLLVGPRQVGKTTLLYNEFLNKGYSYVTLDDMYERSMAQKDPIGFLKSHDYPLIIDEVQKAVELFPELEKIVNERRLSKGIEANGMYILTGSQSKSLLERAQESLAGRVAIIEMMNLSLNEINEKENIPFYIDIERCVKKTNSFHLNDFEVLNYIIRGMYPELYNNPDVPTNLFYSSYISTVMEKDVKDIISLNDDTKFLKFLRIVASNIGQEVIYDSYMRDLEVDAKTAKSWLNVLQKCGIIYFLEPYYEASFVKRVIKRPKMYFSDTGLAAFLIGLDSPETLSKNFFKGRFIENFILNEIKKTYINAGISQSLYYYRDVDQKEVDLVLIYKGVMHLVEMKSSLPDSKHSIKAFKLFENTKYEKGKNCVICPCDKIGALDEDCYILPISVI